MRDIAVYDMTARIDHFEPLEFAQGFVALGNRILNRIFNAFR